jgi:hypothetical protein
MLLKQKFEASRLLEASGLVGQGAWCTISESDKGANEILVEPRTSHLTLLSSRRSRTSRGGSHCWYVGGRSKADSCVPAVKVLKRELGAGLTPPRSIMLHQPNGSSSFSPSRFWVLDLLVQCVIEHCFPLQKYLGVGKPRWILYYDVFRCCHNGV